MLNSDYRDILQILLRNKVEFLVIGAYALATYGYPRATGDLDIWVKCSLENSKKIYHSLREFGSPLFALDEKSFSEKNIIFQIGIVPRRIDLLTSIDGVDFSKAYLQKKEFPLDNMIVPVISLKDLIRNKESTGREKDQLDAKILNKILKKRKKF